MSSTTMLRPASTILLMAKRRKPPLTRETFVKNLKLLMERRGYSQHELSRRSGVAQRTIGKILKGETTPSVETADKLSRAFGLNLWHLIVPNLPDELIDNPSIEKLFNSWMVADDDGREYIERTAEREAARTGSGEKKGAV